MGLIVKAVAALVTEALEVQCEGHQRYSAEKDFSLQASYFSSFHHTFHPLMTIS